MREGISRTGPALRGRSAVGEGLSPTRGRRQGRGRPRGLRRPWPDNRMRRRQSLPGHLRRSPPPGPPRPRRQRRALLPRRRPPWSRCCPCRSRRRLRSCSWFVLSYANPPTGFGFIDVAADLCRDGHACQLRERGPAAKHRLAIPCAALVSREAGLGALLVGVDLPAAATQVVAPSCSMKAMTSS